MDFEGPPGRVAALAAARARLLREVQAVVPGPVLCGAEGAPTAGVGGVMAEGCCVCHQGRCSFSTREIPNLMAAAAAGIVFQAHGRAACGAAGAPCEKPPCPSPRIPDYNEPQVQTELAAFLVGMGRHSYYVCGWWENGSVDAAWLPLYDLPLGEPLADAVLEDGVWRRAFASGTRASFNTTSDTGTVVWAKPVGGRHVGRWV